MGGLELQHRDAVVRDADQCAAPVRLEAVEALGQRRVLPLPRQRRLPERPRVVERTSSRRRCFLAQRPDLEHAHQLEAEAVVEPLGRLVLLDHLQGHGPRRLGQHRLHQPAADAAASRGGCDPDTTDPGLGAAHGQERETDWLAVLERDARAAEVDVPRVDDEPQRRLVDVHRDEVVLVARSEDAGERVELELRGGCEPKGHSATSARAKSSASKGRRSSTPSPTPTSFTASPSS